MIKIVEHSEESLPEWDAFVESLPGSNLFHLWAWKHVFSKTYGLKTIYLSAQEDNQIVGVLPMLKVRSMVFGNHLTSMPGGIAASNQTVAKILLGHAIEHVKKNRLHFLVLRDSTQKLDTPDLVTDDEHVSMQIDMRPGLESIEQQLSRKTRQRINKAKKMSVHTTDDQSKLPDFYRVYQRAMRERGTPTQGLRFFKNVLAHFSDRTQLINIMQDGVILGGGFSHLFNDTLVCSWSGMLREYLNLNTNYIQMWDILEMSARFEVTWLDLGRSRRDSGSFTHKMQWGAEPVQLYQQFYLNRAKKAGATGSGRNDSAAYRSFVKVWSSLPLPVTEFLGPKLRVQVPFG